MSTIAKENETISATPETAAARPAGPSRSEEPTGRPQPVALEVPVSVNGARTIEGSDKREPFSESTKTVLIFGNGAVIRLASSVAAGQLLFLTNEKTRKEVVCQVVKSKNYRNVSGYVELEFTEPVVGFWGMRFPGDKIASATPAASGSPVSSVVPAAPLKPVAPALPAVPKSEPVVAANSPKVSEIKPAVVTPIAPPLAPVPPVKPIVPVSVKPEIPATPVPLPSPTPVASVQSLPQSAEPRPVVASVLPSSVAPVADATPVLQFPEAKVTAPVEVQAPPAPPAQDSTEALRQQTARLQEQLSSLLFAKTSAPRIESAPKSIPPVDATAFAETTTKILEFANPVSASPAITAEPPASEPVQAKIESTQPSIEIAQPATVTPPPVKSILDVDEDVKIPAWLEPLARNTSAPLSTQELIEREKAKHVAALSTKHELEELAAEPLPAPAPEGPLDLQVPTFGSELPLDQPQFSSEVSSKGSNKGIWIGLVAAVLVLSAAGVRYVNMQSNAAQPKPEALAPVAANVASNNLQPQLQPQALSPTPAKSSAPPASSSVQAAPQTSSAVLPAGRNQAVQPSAAVSAGSIVNANAKIDVARSAEPPQPAPQPKKPSLGEVRLAAPTVNRKSAPANANESEPAIEESTGTASNSEGLGSGILAGNAKQPVAPKIPLPVGGDVKTAKLISLVPAVYSTLAKAQHISGDVKIDALIDETGRVTTMKVVSGPTLLHQSAMDALRQWKYQPATLDGKAVPMHLTVTIQFRMQ